jgi:hypothetical protein
METPVLVSVADVCKVELRRADGEPRIRNKETPEALAWLEEHYDPQDYSLWQVDYKYNDELTQGMILACLFIRPLF